MILGWQYDIRILTFLRMDSVMYGVMLAYFKEYFEATYTKFSLGRIPKYITCVGFVIIHLLYVNYLSIGDNFNNSVWGKVFLWCIISSVCAFFVMWFETSVFINEHMKCSNILRRIFTTISSISYPLYLIHWGIFSEISKKCHGILGGLIAISLSLALAYLIHKYFEIPIMRMRDAWSGRNKLNTVES